MAQLVLFDKARVAEWVAREVNQGADWGSYYAMGVERDGEMIAGVVINNFNGANATCHIAIKRFTKAIVPLFQHVCHYAFNQCKLKRLTGMVPSNEPHIIAFDKHIGFEEEFVMRDGAPGADMHVLVMWPDTCRWLRKE